MGVRLQLYAPWARTHLWLIYYLSFMAASKMVAAVPCGSLDQWVEVGTDSAALNTALLQWTNNGCSGTIVFTSNGATLRLSTEFTLSQDLTLNASGLASGVTLLAAPASRHFWTSAVLRASKVTFAGGRLHAVNPVDPLAVTGYGGSVSLDYGSGYFQSCTFRNNTVTSTGDGGGGAIYLSGDTNSLEMINCTVHHNSVFVANVGYGGGLLAWLAGRVVLTRTKFLHNLLQAPNLAFGGGAYLATLPGGAVVESSTFSHNKAVGRTNIGGGGLGAFDCNARIKNSSFNFNQLLSDLTTPGPNSMVMKGGGMYLADPVVNLTSIALTGNVIGPKNTSCVLAEQAYGAGAYIKADRFRGHLLRVVGNRIEALTNMGTGLFAEVYAAPVGSSFSLTSSIVEENLALASVGLGGGLYLLTPSSVLRDVMIRNNTIRMTDGTGQASGAGAGVYMEDVWAAGMDLRITNVTIAANTIVAERSAATDAYGAGVTLSYCNIWVESSTITGNQILLTVPLGISAIGRGGAIHSFNSGVSVRHSFVTNNVIHIQRGSTSNTAAGGGFDTIRGSIDVLNSTLSGNLVMASGTLEGGAICSSGLDFGTITDSTIKANLLVGGSSALGGGVSLAGATINWSNVTTLGNSITVNHTDSLLSGSGYGGGAAFAGTTVLRGCTFQGNRISLAPKHGVMPLSLAGAGVYAAEGSLKLYGCSILSNTISITPTGPLDVSAYGGGLLHGQIVPDLILIAEGLVIKWSTLRDNRVVVDGSCLAGAKAQGGGVACFGADSIIKDSSIVGNGVESAFSAEGGGVYLQHTDAGPTQIQRCNVSGNSVDIFGGQTGSLTSIVASGGGVYVGTGQLFLWHCNVTSNLVSAQGASATQPAAAAGGGVMVIDSASLDMNHVCVEDNMARQLAPAFVADGFTYARGGGLMITDGAALLVYMEPMSIFINNRVQSPFSMAGGAVYASPSAILMTDTLRVIEYPAPWPANTVVNTFYYGDTTSPTLAPTVVTESPTVGPTVVTANPTAAPSLAPTQVPTSTAAATPGPTISPTDHPTVVPSVVPTRLPTSAPTPAPTLPPSTAPSLLPSQTPTLPPTSTPTASPTLAPSSSPTVPPTMAPLPVLITVLSQRQQVQGGRWLVDVDSPLQLYGGDGLLGSVSLSYSWHSPNSTAPACLLSSGPYLTVRPGCLRAGALYAFRVTVTSAQGQAGTQQVVVSGNSPPSNGTCLPSPHTGMALSTRFTVRCVWWADAEGHYPLSYQFSAHTPTRHVALSTATNTSTIATVLPEGSNLSVVTTVRDVYGASTVAATRNLTASPLTLASLTSLLQHTASRVDAATVLNETVFYEALLVVTEGAALDPSLQTNTTTGVLLGVLERLSLSRVVLDGSTAAGLAGCLELLTAPLASATAPLPTSLTMARVNSSLAIASVLASRSTAAHDGLSTSLVTTISHVIAAGALGTDASTSLSAGAASQIQDVIHSLSQAYATTMTPGSDDQTFQSPHIAFSVGVSLLDGATPVVMNSPAAEETSLNISTGAAAELATALDTPMIVRKAIQWSLNGQTNNAEDLSVNGDASSTPRLLSNLSTWEIGTIKNGTLQRASVSGLSSPLILSQRSNRVAQRYAAPPVQQRCPNCPDTYQALCHYTASSADGWNNNSSRSIECHSSGGTSSCQCPVQDRCAFWEKETRQWSSRGCRMLGSADDEAVTRCSCDHLTTFAVLADTAAFVVATAAMGESLNRETLQKSLGLVVFLAALYAAFLGGLVLIRYRRTRESLAYLKRVPQTRMFVTVTSALLGNYRRRTDARMEVTSATRSNLSKGTMHGRIAMADDARSLDEVLDSVVGRRRRKLEGLRAYLRSYMPGRRLLGTGTGTVSADTSDKASDTYRTPITKLTQQQAYLKAFITVATQLVLSIVVTGPNPPPIKDYLLSVTGVHLDSTALFLLFSTTVQQCIVTEPVTRILDILFYAINKETSVQKSVSELIVDRDLPLAVPHSAAQAGRRYVPLLRISLLQLEMIDRVVQDGTALQPSTNKILDEADTLTMATRRLLLDPKEARVVHRTLDSRIYDLRQLLRQEYYDAKELAWEQRTRGGTLTSRRSIKFASSSPLMVFRANPLEVFEVEARMSRDYDHWVMTALYHRRFRDWAKRTYYHLFVADPSEHVMTQERFLFSWRLLLIDGVLLAYMLLITFIALLLGLNATANIVGFALFSMVTGVIGNVLVLSPLVTIIQGRFTHRLLLAITDDVAKSQDTFRQQYERNANKREDEDPVVPLSLYANEYAARTLIQRGRLSTADPRALENDEGMDDDSPGASGAEEDEDTDDGQDTVRAFVNLEAGDDDQQQLYERASMASDAGEEELEPQEQDEDDEGEDRMTEVRDSSAEARDSSISQEARDSSTSEEVRDSEVRPSEADIEDEDEDDEDGEEEEEEDEEKGEEGDAAMRGTTTLSRLSRRAE